MAIKVFQFLALVLTALCLVPAGAHLASLPHKIGLGPVDYLVVQRIYAGWQYFGVPLIGAIICSGVLAVLARGTPAAALLALFGFLLLALTLGLFFLFVYPGNVATENWTNLPDGWEDLRTRWEYGHAVNAVITLVAFILLALSVLLERG